MKVLAYLFIVVMLYGTVFCCVLWLMACLGCKKVNQEFTYVYAPPALACVLEPGDHVKLSVALGSSGHPVRLVSEEAGFDEIVAEDDTLKTKHLHDSGVYTFRLEEDGRVAAICSVEVTK
jgi:hypothetical protein